MIKRFAGESEVYLSYWKEGLSAKKMNWKGRLKLIWKIITTGTPYSDMVILSRKTAKSLANYLNKIS
jgi:hypothetical protein